MCKLRASSYAPAAGARFPSEPKYFAPSDKPRGVGEHPHRGFETVTIAYQGSVAHRDSGGNAGTIRPGDVQWMTAASGVVHEEMHDPEFTRTGGTFEMIQLWVNLPRALKMSAPRYQTLETGRIPQVEFPKGGYARVIAGELEGVKGPASTFTPVNRLSEGLPPPTATSASAPTGALAPVDFNLRTPSDPLTGRPNEARPPAA